ncbi:MAG: hypothetical protein ACUVSV_08450 [Armatimonadota bacterium]
MNQAEIGILIPGVQCEMAPAVQEFLAIPEEQYEPIRLVVAKEVIEAQSAFGIA